MPMDTDEKCGCIFIRVDGSWSQDVTLGRCVHAVPFKAGKFLAEFS